MEESYNITGAKEGNESRPATHAARRALKRMLQQFTIRFKAELQVERTEMLQPNGDRIVTSYSNESRAPIDAGMFEFTPPAGTKVTTPLGR